MTFYLPHVLQCHNHCHIALYSQRNNDYEWFLNYHGKKAEVRHMRQVFCLNNLYKTLSLSCQLLFLPCIHSNVPTHPSLAHVEFIDFFIKIRLIPCPKEDVLVNSICDKLLKDLSIVTLWSKKPCSSLCPRLCGVVGTIKIRPTLLKHAALPLWSFVHCNCWMDLLKSWNLKD